MLRDPVDKWLSNAFYWTREAKQSVGGGGPADAVRRRSAQRERRWLPYSRARRRRAGAPLRRRLTPWRHAVVSCTPQVRLLRTKPLARWRYDRAKTTSVCAPREERLLLPRPLRAFLHRRDTHTHTRARVRDPIAARARPQRGRRVRDRGAAGDALERVLVVPAGRRGRPRARLRRGGRGRRRGRVRRVRARAQLEPALGPF